MGKYFIYLSRFVMAYEILFMGERYLRFYQYALYGNGNAWSVFFNMLSAVDYKFILYLISIR